MPLRVKMQHFIRKVLTGEKTSQFSHESFCYCCACECHTFLLAFWRPFVFVLVCLHPASFLVSQRSPRLFSHDHVPMSVEQRACQLAALLESRRALRHQVTTALPVRCPGALGDSGYRWNLGAEREKNHQKMMTTTLQSCGWNRHQDYFCLCLTCLFLAVSLFGEWPFLFLKTGDKQWSKKQPVTSE